MNGLQFSRRALGCGATQVWRGPYALLPKPYWPAQVWRGPYALRPKPYWPAQVWRVLTDYERLAEFVPNLERCERLPKGPNGRVILRQVGRQPHPTVYFRSPALKASERELSLKVSPEGYITSQTPIWQLLPL